jgi:hypothetical protein
MSVATSLEGLEDAGVVSVGLGVPAFVIGGDRTERDGVIWVGTSVWALFSRADSDDEDDGPTVLILGGGP